MKHKTLKCLFSLLILLSSCNGTQDKAKQAQPASLHHTFALYYDKLSGAIKASDVYYVIRDSTYLDTAANPIKKVTITDTIYFPPSFYDVIDSVTKQPRKDSAGQPVKNRVYEFEPDSLIWILKPEVRLPNDSEIIKGFKDLYVK